MPFRPVRDSRRHAETAALSDDHLALTRHSCRCPGASLSPAAVRWRRGEATEIVRRVSNGEGLLSNGGASVNNLVSGDAPRCYLTMSKLEARPGGLGDSQAFGWFFVSPCNYLHLIVRFIGETLKELFQARRQVRADVEPRMPRGFPYPFLRATTNVVLRALGTSLVLEEMYRGTPVIYIDFTDYDEIAHHSGPERPDALDALDGIDRVLGTFEKAAEDASRPYRFIVLSDHGQTLGATFRQRFGESLEDVVRRLITGSPRSLLQPPGLNSEARSMPSSPSSSRRVA